MTTTSEETPRGALIPWAALVAIALVQVALAAAEPPPIVLRAALLATSTLAAGIVLAWPMRLRSERRGFALWLVSLVAGCVLLLALAFPDSARQARLRSTPPAEVPADAPPAH